MITCNVCGHLNDPSSVVCENCGSDLSDSPDWDDNDDIYEEDNVYDDGFVDSGMGDEDNEYYDDEYYD